MDKNKKIKFHFIRPLLVETFFFKFNNGKELREQSTICDNYSYESNLNEINFTIYNNKFQKNYLVSLSSESENNIGVFIEEKDFYNINFYIKNNLNKLQNFITNYPKINQNIIFNLEYNS